MDVPERAAGIQSKDVEVKYGRTDIAHQMQVESTYGGTDIACEWPGGPWGAALSVQGAKDEAAPSPAPSAKPRTIGYRKAERVVMIDGVEVLRLATDAAMLAALLVAMLRKPDGYATSGELAKVAGGDEDGNQVRATYGELAKKLKAAVGTAVLATGPKHRWGFLPSFVPSSLE